MRIIKKPLHWMRSLYRWMLGLAQHPKAESMLFGISVAEASFFPLPPDPLLLVMGGAKPKKALRFALITTAGSVIGAIAGWIIGHWFMDIIGTPILNIYDADRATWEKIVVWYKTYGNMALLLAALTPIPFKIFTIASGALGYPLIQFFIASLVGRGLRFGAEGLLLHYWGKSIIGVIEKWFDLIAILFTILIIGGFLSIAWL